MVLVDSYGRCAPIDLSHAKSFLCSLVREGWWAQFSSVSWFWGVVLALSEDE